MSFNFLVVLCVFLLKKILNTPLIQPIAVPELLPIQNWKLNASCHGRIFDPPSPNPQPPLSPLHVY